MTFRYSIKWAYIELIVALGMAVAVYSELKPGLWGWLLFAPLLVFMVFMGVRKVSYSLTVDGDLITIGGLKPAQYSVSKISALNVWEAKGGRIAVVAFNDGRRFNFPSRLDGFDDLVALLRSKANLP